MKSAGPKEAITIQPPLPTGPHPDRLGTVAPPGLEPNGESALPTAVPVRQSKLLLRLALAVVGVAVGVAAVAYYLRFIAPFESTDNASIESHVTPMAMQVAGRVAHLYVQDNQEVRQGDVLLELDPADYEARLAQAQAGLAAARSQLAQANAQLAVDQAKAGEERAGLTAAEAQAGLSQSDLQRYQSVESRAVSRSQIDLAETQARAAAAQVEVVRNKVLEAEAMAGLSQAAIATATANIQQSEAAVRQAELNLSYVKITAPEDGRVTHRTVEQGAYVLPGQALLAIVPRQCWVVANFKETQLAHMRVGQPVEIKVDAYPDRTFHGHVESLQAGAGARFSLFPPENATGNFIKVVQRVPVKIVLDDADPNLALGPGMSVEPTVRVQ